MRSVSRHSAPILRYNLPLERVLHLQDAVVQKEPREGPERELLHAAGIGGPDGRSHGDEEKIDEPFRVAPGAQIGDERPLIA